MRPIVSIYRLGRTPYNKALKIQNIIFNNLKRVITSPGYCNKTKGIDNNRRVDDKSKGEDSITKPVLGTNHGSRLEDLLFKQQFAIPTRNSLVLVEHEPVYTVGLRTQLYGQDYASKLREVLAENNLKADFERTNRGGLITFHGPGQLVAYPIMYLGDFKHAIPGKSVKAYVKKLEDTIIDTLARVGVNGAHTVREYPGVWLAGGERKVAFVGITCKHYITMHGISINCDCDLSWFDYIVSCGIKDKLITSIKCELTSAAEHVVGGRSDSAHLEGEQVRSNQDGIHDSSVDGHLSHINIKRPLTRKSRSSNQTYSVHNVANAFCSSFSCHFDCELLEG